MMAGACLAPLIAPPIQAQEAKEPTRRESFEHDGILWGSAAAWGVPFQENLSEDAKIAGLGRLWMEVKINFPNFAAVSDLDWDRTYVDFIPKVRASTSTYEYYRLLQQMTVLLKDGHTEVFLPKELAGRMEADVPIRIDEIENRVFVVRVCGDHENSLGDLLCRCRGLRRGGLLGRLFGLLAHFSSPGRRSSGS